MYDRMIWPQQYDPKPQHLLLLR